MKRASAQRKGWRVWLVGAILSATIFQAVPAARADEGADWKAFNALEEQLADVRATEPEKAISALQQWFVARPELHPMVGSTLSARVLDIYLDDLKDTDKAIEVGDWAIKRYEDAPPTHPVQAVVLEGYARALIAAQRAPDAEKLLLEHWPQIVAAAQSRQPYLVMYASRSLQQLNRALEEQKKSDTTPALMQRILLEMPVFLDDRKQGSDGWRDGWMWETLIGGLMNAKQEEAALRWAKLGFAECAFDKDAIARATHNLARVWAKKEDFVRVQAFTDAQNDNAKTSPLSEIGWPHIEVQVLAAQLKRLQPGQKVAIENAPETIGVLLAAGNVQDAMRVARQLMVDAPEAPESAQQVCRVFKAADGSIRRANQFVQYLQGKAPDPLADFFNETKVVS